jgi:hypothetical protein
LTAVPSSFMGVTRAGRIPRMIGGVVVMVARFPFWWQWTGSVLVYSW